jgi:hypothetical protein
MQRTDVAAGIHEDVLVLTTWNSCELGIIRWNRLVSSTQTSTKYGWGYTPERPRQPQIDREVRLDPASDAKKLNNLIVQHTLQEVQAQKSFLDGIGIRARG